LIYSKKLILLYTLTCYCPYLIIAKIAKECYSTNRLRDLEYSIWYALALCKITGLEWLQLPVMNTPDFYTAVLFIQMKKFIVSAPDLPNVWKQDWVEGIKILVGVQFSSIPSWGHFNKALSTCTLSLV
jgi:hypothetical protein